MTNAETISVAASNNDLITECSCVRRSLDRRPNRNCPVCSGHGFFTTCQKCEGCGMHDNAICKPCGGKGTFAASSPATKKKTATSLR